MSIIPVQHGANLNDYAIACALILGVVDANVACADRNAGNVYVNESTVPQLLVNGGGQYLGGCRGAVVREGNGASFWVFIQSFDGTSTPIQLTRIQFSASSATPEPVQFITSSLNLSINDFSSGTARWCSDSTVIFAAGLSIYKFSPQTLAATAIFTAASGDPTFGDGTSLRLSNLANGKVLAFTPDHIYLVDSLTGGVLNSWAITAFGLGANTLTRCQYDGANTAWVIAAPGADVYSLNLGTLTAAALTSGTDYTTYSLVYNSIKQLLGLTAFGVTTFTTIAVPGGAINTGTLPAGATNALAVDDDGFFWTSDSFAQFATPAWKIDPVALTVVVTVGSRSNSLPIPAGDTPQGGNFAFALIPFTPPGNGAILDADTLTPLNNWCRANSISVALCQDSQRTAKDLLDELFTVGNSAPVYSGDTLKVIPYDEVSAAGNGAVYIAPTASGPVANLTDQDFAVSTEKNPVPPLKFTRKRRASCDNVVAIEHIDRSLDYMHNVTSVPDQVHVALFGPRKGGSLDAAELGMNVPSGSKSFLSISQASVAQAIASILVKRSAAGENQYEFTLKAEWAMVLEAMDLITITDTRLGLQAVPVRLTQVKENEKGTIDCTAEAFIYGLNHPAVATVSAATGTLVLANVDPGLVNTPIIFEPPAGMLPEGSGPQVWFLISGADPNFSGCVIYVSVDGGATYQPLSNAGPANTGVLTADYPNNTDPDTTDQLKIDLTESNGSISPQTQQIADGFADPCFIAGAGSTFEVVCPTAATLTSAEHYTLGTYIRRAVEGTVAMDHPTSSRFAIIDGATVKIDLPAQWVGKTIHLKFAAYNKLGGQQNSLADCVDYTFTPVSTFLPGGFYVNGS